MMSEEIKHLALEDWHRERGAKFVPFAGWHMPVQYKEGILGEHRAVRERAGLFDVSHMGEFTVSGAGAADFLDGILVGQASALEPGRALYSLLCHEDGGVVDDLIVYRDGPEEFFLCVNAANREKDLAWVLEKLPEGAPVVVRDISNETGLLALQGPRAEAIMARVMGREVSARPPFSFSSETVDGVPVRLSRTGYTGEPGFELYLPMDRMEPVAEAIWKAGEGEGLTMTGLGARDSLRLEAGLSLYGHEIDRDISPVQAGLSWTVAWKKEAAFPGKDALVRQKKEGVESKVVFFRTGQRRIIRAGETVYDGDEEVGRVLSGTMSPILNEAIGSALVRFPFPESSEWTVQMRGQTIALQKKKPPLHR